MNRRKSMWGEKWMLWKMDEGWKHVEWKMEMG